MKKLSVILGLTTFLTACGPVQSQEEQRPFRPEDLHIVHRLTAEEYILVTEEELVHLMKMILDGLSAEEKVEIINQEREQQGLGLAVLGNFQELIARMQPDEVEENVE